MKLSILIFTILLALVAITEQLDTKTPTKQKLRVEKLKKIDDCKRSAKKGDHLAV
jgi:hypothetical protein